MLTPKQEKFAQAIADGMSQADAYRSAFNVRTKKQSTVHDSASKLMAKPDVSHRVDEIRSSLSEKRLWTREMSVKALMQTYRDGTGAVRVAAVKELNSMHGYNAESKDNSQPVKIVLNIGGKPIDPEQLGW